MFKKKINYSSKVKLKNLFSANFGKVSISITVCIIGVIANLVSIFVIVVLKEYKKSVLHM